MGERGRRPVVLLAAAMVAALPLASCSGSREVDRGSVDRTSATSRSPAEDKRESDNACALLAATIQTELARWTGTSDIDNAPVAAGRLGPQAADGLPGNLDAGCVWESRRPSGGHVAVAVELFRSTDAVRLAAMADERNAATPGGVVVAPLPGGFRYDIARRNDTPGGAVLVLTGTDMVAVRVESHSDDTPRGYLASIKDREAAFFAAVGDALVVDRTSRRR